MGPQSADVGSRDAITDHAADTIGVSAVPPLENGTSYTMGATNETMALSDNGLRPSPPARTTPAVAPSAAAPRSFMMVTA